MHYAGYRNPTYLDDPLREEMNTYAAEFQELMGIHSERLRRIAEYREEMNLARDPRLRDQSTDYGRRTQQGKAADKFRHQLILPFGQALTVKHAYRVAGRMPDVVADRRDNSDEERYRADTIEKICWGIMRESRADVQLSEVGWDGSLTGSGVFETYWNAKKNMALFRAVDPATFLPVLGFDDPHSFERAYRFWIVPVRSLRASYRITDFRGNNYCEFLSGQKYDADEYCTVVDMYDRNRFLRFVYESCTPVDETTHNYGFVPYSVFPNLGPYREVWGWSDYEFVRSLVFYIQNLLSREADIFRMVSGGAYMDKRTGASTGIIQQAIQEGGIVPVHREGSIEPIPSPDMPDYLPTHVDLCLRYLKMLGFAPDASWGDGLAASGQDRNLQLGPQVELTALKQINLGASMSRMFQQCLLMTERLTRGPAKYRGHTYLGGLRHAPFNLAITPLITAPDDLAIDNPPTTLEELFDGDYFVNVNWSQRFDPDDPAYVMSELNKFQQGVQSVYTTLSRLGVAAPEDEVKLLEKEADEFPWLRQGMIALINGQLGQAQASEQQGGLGDALGTMMGTRANDADFGPADQSFSSG